MAVNITPVFCNDSHMANYAYLINQSGSNQCIIIDAAEARPIIEKLNEKSLIPTHILTTHHHFDHVGGNEELKEKYNLKIIAPQKEFAYVPAADIAAEENTELNINNLCFKVIAAAGHTLGHVIYYLKEANALFTGDVLFNLSVGGLFEGTPQQMMQSLEKIKSLPDNTLIFAGHEYTHAGITKELLQHPEFSTYLQKMQKREQGENAPATLYEEKLFNPYLKSNFFTE